MNGRGDYPDDMSDLPLDDAGAEAVLAGEVHAGDPELVAVAAFVSEMRASASRPAPAPSPALAALLRDGSVVSAPAPRRPVLSTWRRRLAVTGIGLGVSVTGVVGAGAAGLLPAPVERVVGGVLEAVTPLRLRDRGADRIPGPSVGGQRPEDIAPGAPTGPAGRPGTGETAPGSSPDAGPGPAITARPGGSDATSTGPSPHAPPPAAGPGNTSPSVPPVGPGPSPTPPTSLPPPPPLPSPTLPNVTTSVPVTPPTVPGQPVTVPSLPR